MRPGKAIGIAVAVLCLFGLGAQPSVASRIVYSCGSNLCSVQPDGSGKAQLTRGGGYSSPSLSRSGRRLAFVRHNVAYLAKGNGSRPVDLGLRAVLAVSLRPDGRRVAAINYQAEPGGLSPYLILVNPDGSGYETASRGPFTAGWLGNKLLRDGYSLTSHQCRAGFLGDCPAYSICRVNVETGSCIANVADDPVRDLSDPAGSPDRRLVAATATAYPDDGSAHADRAAGAIAIYDAATGQLVRNLTRGGSDSHPAFSPDGRQLAFDRGNGIYVIGIDGPPARPHRIATGTTPTWGGGSDRTGTRPDTRIVRAAVAPRSRRASFRLRASGGNAPYAFRCRLSGQSANLYRWRRCGNRPVFSNLKPGRHVFSARAVDSSGRVDPKPARYEFRIPGRAA